MKTRLRNRAYMMLKFQVMNKIERQREFMKTTITIKVVQNEEKTIGINEAIELAYGEFDRIVKKYTRFDENSELSNLNRKSGKWVKVSDEFLFLIRYMLDLAKKTNGAFDPTIIDFLEVYGYDKNYDFSKLENPKLDSLVKNIQAKRNSWKAIEINIKDNKVKLAKGQRIDLGGVGKGYAIDKAFEQLERAADNFLIDAGGDIRVKGKSSTQRNWVAGLRAQDSKKNEPTLVGQLELKSGEALASSGSWARKIKQFHHIINPKTGSPVIKDYSTVFVKGPSGIEADAWATALFVNSKLEPGNQFSAMFV